MNTKTLRILSHALFLLGVIIGLVLTVIAIWNNVESTSYFFRGVTYAPFHGWRCPMVIAPTEKGIVTAVFNNPTDEKDEFFYRVEISGKAYTTRQMEGQVAVLAHQAKSVQVTVDAHDVDLLFFILVKLTIMPNSVHPSQEAVCGMMMVNFLGLTGAQIATIGVFLSFLGMAIGLGLWQRTSTKPNQEMPRAIQALGFTVLLAMFAAALGWWTIAIALVVITILLMLISLRFAVA